jgi:SAM-dependent methyltransferase
MEPEKALKCNRESWDQRTPLHLSSRMYRRDIETLRTGGIALLPPTDRELPDVAGKRVLHLQCHIGTDTLSLARLGAEVTGLDFSPASVAAARSLSEELGIEARFVEGDAQRADEALAGERFDVVFASYGVFCWIPDLQAWMRSAYRLLRSGGVLYVADGHPFLDVFEDDASEPRGIDIRYSYFDQGPMRFGPGPSYADEGRGQDVGATVEYPYTLGSLVTGVSEAGFRVEYLHEYPLCFFHRFSCMEETAEGQWSFPPPLEGKLPGVFSLRASRP